MPNKQPRNFCSTSASRLPHISKAITGLVLMALMFINLGTAQAGSPTEPVVSGVPNLIRVPLTRQAADYTCGVTAVQSILGYYGFDMRLDTLADRLKPDPNNGTNYRNIVNLALSLGLEVTGGTNLTLDELKKFIDAGTPVLVVIQAWMDPPVDWSTYNDGHYVVVIGYDENNFYFMDPATLGHYTYIPTAEFMERWHDRDSFQNIDLVRAALIFSRSGGERFNPEQITKMK